MMDEAMRDYLLSFDGVDDGPVYINRSGRRIGAGEWLFASDSVGGVVSVVPARTATDRTPADIPDLAFWMVGGDVRIGRMEGNAVIPATREDTRRDPLSDKVDDDDQEGDLAE